MDKATAIRSAVLLIPFAVVLVAQARVSPRVRGAALLGTLWCFCALLAVNVLGSTTGWWAFNVEGGTLLGVPVDLLLGWSVMWGALPALLPQGRAWLWVVVFLWIDVLLMGHMQPVVRLGDGWLIGEFASIVVALIPALALVRFTLASTHFALRVALQVALFAMLTFFVVPSIAFDQRGSSWSAEFSDVSMTAASIWLQVLAIPGVVAITAVLEFARRGGGTPFPWDPPLRLVTSGPYAYVRNPMQLSMTVMLLLAGVALSNWWLVLTAVVAAAFSSGIAEWNEHDHLRVRHGEAWLTYRRELHNWVPSLRPAPLIPQARLYVAVSCDPCSRIGSWFARRARVNLQLLPAESHPEQLRRIRYESRDLAVSGTRAVGYALEHLHLGWALAGWLLRFPVLATCIQVIVDGVGGGPRELPNTAQTVHSFETE